MKNSARYLAFFLVIALVTSGCGLIRNFNPRLIVPSDVMITETREVSGFSSINMSTFGKLVISQGNTESLSISGSDNLVPLIKTRVSNGVLIIDTDQNLGVTTINENKLTLTIAVKDLTAFTVSGLSDILIDALSTPSLDITLSGAGNAQIKQLTTDSLNVSLSGLGNVDLAGEVQHATFQISGAGSVKAPDLKIQDANVSVPGLGSASLWVTGSLTGNISGAGSVSYYGNPQTSTNASGLGSFKSLGNK